MGWVWTVTLNLILIVGAYLASAFWFRQPRGLPRVLSVSVLAWSWVTIGEQILGTFGGIGRVSMLGWVLLGLAIAVSGRFLLTVPQASDILPVSTPRWDPPALFALGLTVWVSLVIGIPSLLFPVKVVSDGPIYHLYFAVRWWKSGFLDLIPTPFGETAATYFPANGELGFLWLLTGLGADTLAKVGQAPALLVVVSACYGLARQVGAGPSAALLAATWFATCSPLIVFSFEPNVDTLVTAAYLVSAFFLVRFATDAGGSSLLVLSGLSAGLALGSKPTSIVFLPPLLTLGLIVIFQQRRGPRQSIFLSVGFLLTALLPCGYWYGRNAWLTGNPLYPVHLEIGGWTLLSGWYPRSAMSTSPYYVPVRDLAFLVDTVLTVFDARMFPLWVVALGGLWMVRGSGSRQQNRWVWVFSALSVVNLALFWVVIPYRTQPRFMLPTVGLAAIPLARLLDRSLSLRWLASALLGLHLLTPWDWPGLPHLSRWTPPSAPLIRIPPNVDEILDKLQDLRRSLTLIPIFLVGPLTLASVFLMARWWRSRTFSRFLPACACGLMVVALSVGSPIPAVSGRWPMFPFFPDYLRAWHALDYFSGPRGSRVAYAGTDIPYYLFGRNLKNDVFYVNIVNHPDWLMHDFQRTAQSRGEPVLWNTSRPGWGRLKGEINAWVQNLMDARIDFLVVARCRPEQGPFNLADPERFPIERVWAQGNPDFFSPVYGVDPPDPNMKIFRFHREKIRRIGS